MSEIKALAGVDNAAQGIDVGQKDSVNGKDTQKLQKTGQLVCSYAKKAHAVAMASGAVDIISDGSQVWFVKNGVAELSKVTGTGCMLNVITATYLSVTDPLTACLLSAGALGICGELADKSRGMGCAVGTVFTDTTCVIGNTYNALLFLYICQSWISVLIS